jgi:hypothetical protein
MLRESLLRLTLCAGTLLLTACSTDYHAFPQSKIVSGSGGEKSSFHGIDLWTAGLPPRKFEVIGSIIDNRPSGAFAMCLKGSQIASLAKQKGGDALIMEYDRTGMEWKGLGNGQQNPAHSETTADITANPIRRDIAKYYVIRYLSPEN